MAEETRSVDEHGRAWLADRRQLHPGQEQEIRPWVRYKWVSLLLDKGCMDRPRGMAFTCQRGD